MKLRITLLTLLFGIMASSTFSTCQEKDPRTRVLISTDMGDITVWLYDKTPQHRDNFVKLVEEGWYNGSIFHRIIADFMIQGGWNAEGKQDPGYKIPAEFVDGFYHKKGVLSAARMGDQFNPERESSGCQFYIVEGQVFDDKTLDSFEARMGIEFTTEQRETYKTVGGTPHLDGAYTVFGEVIDGLDVVDKISAVQTGEGDRPINDIKMTMTLIK